MRKLKYFSSSFLTTCSQKGKQIFHYFFSSAPSSISSNTPHLSLATYSENTLENTALSILSQKFGQV
jgi:hypothetical protein